MLGGGGVGHLGAAVPDVAVPEAGHRVEVGAAAGVVGHGGARAAGDRHDAARRRGRPCSRTRSTWRAAPAAPLASDPSPVIPSEPADPGASPQLAPDNLLWPDSGHPGPVSRPWCQHRERLRRHRDRRCPRERHARPRGGQDGGRRLGQRHPQRHAAQAGHDQQPAALHDQPPRVLVVADARPGPAAGRSARAGRGAARSAPGTRPAARRAARCRARTSPAGTARTSPGPAGRARPRRPSRARRTRCAAPRGPPRPAPAR